MSKTSGYIRVQEARYRQQRNPALTFTEALILVCKDRSEFERSLGATKHLGKRRAANKIARKSRRNNRWRRH